MSDRKSRILFHNGKTASQDEYTTAVSLHCHTNRSKEGLHGVPSYASRIPILSSIFMRETHRYKRLTGQAIDFADWYWTPPPSAQAVIESETGRIGSQLGLRALVSLSDHDDISAPRAAHASGVDAVSPISLEWTVPVNGVHLHLGVHNLPAGRSVDIANDLAGYTREPKTGTLSHLLPMLSDSRGTLLVMNHPLSTPDGMGSGRLRQVVTEFLDHHGDHIHALEINGYRPWSENRMVMRLAGQFGKPVVSGGDRHGTAPNAIVNMTKADTFSAFVDELRRDKVSTVLVMPEYQEEDVIMRKLAVLTDFFRYYPDYPAGHRRWTDRVFVKLDDGVIRPVSKLWDHTTPAWIKSVMWCVDLMARRYIQPAFRMSFVRRIGLALWGHVHAVSY